MKILHISSNTHGGAGSAAARIHKSFLKHGHDSKMFVRTNHNSIERVIEVNSPASYFLTRASRKIKNKLYLKDQYLMYSVHDRKEWYGIFENLKSLNFYPDVIILHWVAGFIGFDELTHLSDNLPHTKILWYIMDMAPFTSGCHYSWGCVGYTNQCHPCPGVKGFKGQEIIDQMFMKKLKFVSNTELQYVAPNQFVKNQVRLATFAKADVPVVYIPIDEDIFTPKSYNKKGVTLLFGGNSFDDHRKGGDLFAEVLKILDIRLADGKKYKKPVEILAPGLKSNIDLRFKNILFRQQERILGDANLAILYSQSDIFICCSREDSGPIMVSEALMSGLPVVSFDVGAVNELIQNELAGSVIPNYDTTAMADKILKLILNIETVDRELVKKTVCEKLSTSSMVSNFESILA